MIPNYKDNNFIMKAILAGFFIGIADLTSILIENKYIAAVVFSVGLLSIIKQQLYLFTGKIGYCNFKKNEIISVILIYIFNIIGILIVGFYCYNAYGIKVNPINTLEQTSFWILVFQSLFTGMLMFIAVDSKSDFLTVLCVVTFILLQGKHSIAQGFFLWFWKYPVETLIFAIGNTIGAKIIFISKEKKSQSLGNNLQRKI